MSETGQAVLRAHGFDPVALADPVPPPGLLVQRTGSAARILPADRLAGLKPMTQTVTFSEPGSKPTEWSGPTLWDVLGAAGAVDPAKPAEAVHLSVRVTGADGYAAVLALAELSPQFADRPILLAERMNGAEIGNHALRLIVPGEHRAGRSVRDVVRIDVE
jgi:DMSO/TMAO reductase YedYZ molybdopterin-dependent catalytic subunit